MRSKEPRIRLPRFQISQHLLAGLEFGFEFFGVMFRLLFRSRASCAPYFLQLIIFAGLDNNLV
jgi:hypothetical protein